MLDGAAKRVEIIGGREGALVVGSSGDGVNVPTTVTAVVLVAGVIGGLFAVLAVLVCCRYCCASTRHSAAMSTLKRFVYRYRLEVCMIREFPWESHENGKHRLNSWEWERE